MPAAVNLYKVRESKDSAGDLFRSVQKQRPQYQGIWVVAPDGRVLSAHHDIKSHETWTREVLDTLATGLAAFRPVKPREVKPAEPLPNRGVGELPGGGVNLALYSRYVRGGGKERAPAAVNPTSLWLWDGALTEDGPPVIDSVPLTADEWKSFSPPKSGAKTWTLPDSVARKLTRALSPSSDQSTMPKPEEATEAELKAELVSTTGDLVAVRLTGRWAAKHIYDGKASYAWATGAGLMVRDRRTGEPIGLAMTLHGAYRMAPPYDTADRPIGAVIEWRKQPNRD